MTLTQITDSNGRELPRIVECPFCGAEVSGPKVPWHLGECEEAPR